MVKKIKAREKRGEGIHGNFIFFNMDIFDYLSDELPYIYFEKKIRLSDEIWSNLRPYSLYILHTENVCPYRISRISDSFT